jgi:hypothetical protein
MDDTNAVRGKTERREPVSVTLADLSALVVGSALAFSLPQLHYPTDRITIDKIPMPVWVTYLFVIAEVAMKCGLALAPVIVARRARYGGLPRPADWLSILVGTALLHEVIQRFEWMKRFAKWYVVDFRPSLGFPASFLPQERLPGSVTAVGGSTGSAYDGFPADFIPGDEYRLWGGFAMVILLGVSIALAVRWKQMPGWAMTGLLSLAAFTWLAGVNYLLAFGANLVSQSVAEGITLRPDIVRQVALGVATLPEGLLFGVPVVAMLLEFRSGTTKNWSWTTWVGGAIVLFALPSGVMIAWYVDLVTGAQPLAATRLTVQAVRLVAIGLSSWVIAWRVGWA